MAKSTKNKRTAAKTASARKAKGKAKAGRTPKSPKRAAAPKRKRAASAKAKHSAKASRSVIPSRDGNSTNSPKSMGSRFGSSPDDYEECAANASSCASRATF